MKLFFGVGAWARNRRELSKRRKAAEIRRAREKASRTLGPSGDAWSFDQSNPDCLYVLGTSITLDANQGYNLSYFEKAYSLLEQELKLSYPDFSPSGVTLEIDVMYAARLLADRDFLDSLKPEIRIHKPWNYSEPSYKVITGLARQVVFDGQPVKLRISWDRHYREYRFFVPGHPRANQPEDPGMWCRPNPRSLAALTSENTL